MSREKLLFVLSFVFCHNLTFTKVRGNFLTEEVRSLSELPMERLIRIKTSFIDDEGVKESRSTDAHERSTALSLPMALPFKRMGVKKSIRRHGDYWEEKGKGDTKISKIFQLTITALSFLAFGGYLLTLIITAIRRNQTNAANGNVIVFSDDFREVTSSWTKGQDNLQSLQKYKRPKRHAWIIDPLDNDFDTDRMYRGMIMLSQGYAMYHQKLQ